MTKIRLEMQGANAINLNIQKENSLGSSLVSPRLIDHSYVVLFKISNGSISRVTELILCLDFFYLFFSIKVETIVY